MEAKCVMQRNNGFGPGVCTRRGMCMDRDSGQFGRQMERGGGVVGEMMRRQNTRVVMMAWL